MTAAHALSSEVEAALLVGALHAQESQIAVVGSDGRLLFTNQAWADFYGSHPPADRTLSGGSDHIWGFGQLTEAIACDAADLASLEAVLAGDEGSATVDVQCRRCPAPHWLRMSARRIALGDRDVISIAQSDVTAEKAAWDAAIEAANTVEAARRELDATEARFREFVESAHEGVIATDLTGRVTYANSRAASLIGRTRDEVMRHTVFDFMPPDYAFQMRTHFVTLWRGESLTVESVLHGTDGIPVDVLAALSPILERNGDQSGALMMFTDQRPQKQTERALREVQARLQDQFTKLPVPTSLWERRNGSMVLLDCNEAAVRASAVLEQAIGRDIVDIYPTGSKVRDDMVRCLAEDRVLRHVAKQPADNSLGFRQFEVTIGPQQPDRVLLHAVETTERVELEAQLRQSQKMEAVGRLAGGVAHDFNNVLTVIGAHTTFLLRELHPEDPKRHDADAIAHASARAAGLTRQLLAFSRRQILKPEVIDLNACVLESQRLLARLLGEDIDVRLDLANPLGRIMADPGQIDQVLMNLAVNARDAMPSGGSLTISTRQVSVTEGRGQHRFVAPGDYAVLVVHDTGVGMDAVTLGRVFEPFFTTKPQGKGTGLGLATVYGIVKQSGGYVLAESSPGKGASFSVYLPVVQLELTEGGAAGGDTPRGFETILIVEDDAAVRSVAKRLLVEQGYVVLEADTGTAALALSEGYGGEIHVVLTDAVLPNLSGGEVIERLRAERPAIRALLMSGYTDDEVVRRGISSSAIPFIQKPFTSEELARAVRAAIASR